MASADWTSYPLSQLGAASSGGEAAPPPPFVCVDAYDNSQTPMLAGAYQYPYQIVAGGQLALPAIIPQGAHHRHHPAATMVAACPVGIPMGPSIGTVLDTSTIAGPMSLTTSRGKPQTISSGPTILVAVPIGTHEGTLAIPSTSTGGLALVRPVLEPYRRSGPLWHHEPSSGDVLTDASSSPRRYRLPPTMVAAGPPTAAASSSASASIAYATTTMFQSHNLLMYDRRASRRFDYTKPTIPTVVNGNSSTSSSSKLRIQAPNSTLDVGTERAFEDLCGEKGDPDGRRFRRVPRQVDMQTRLDHRDEPPEPQHSRTVAKELHQRPRRTSPARLSSRVSKTDNVQRPQPTSVTIGRRSSKRHTSNAQCSLQSGRASRRERTGGQPSQSPPSPTIRTGTASTERRQSARDEQGSQTEASQQVTAVGSPTTRALREIRPKSSVVLTSGTLGELQSLTGYLVYPCIQHTTAPGLLGLNQHTVEQAAVQRSLVPKELIVPYEDIPAELLERFKIPVHVDLGTPVPAPVEDYDSILLVEKRDYRRRIPHDFRLEVSTNNEQYIILADESKRIFMRADAISKSTENVITCNVVLDGPSFEMVAQSFTKLYARIEQQQKTIDALTNKLSAIHEEMESYMTSLANQDHDVPAGHLEDASPPTSTGPTDVQPNRTRRGASLKSSPAGSTRGSTRTSTRTTTDTVNKAISRKRVNSTRRTSPSSADRKRLRTLSPSRRKTAPTGRGVHRSERQERRGRQPARRPLGH